MHLQSDYHGYCANCLANVEQVRVVKSPVLQWIDRWTWSIPELFGIGPWYCASCGKRRWLFPPQRRSAGNYDPHPIVDTSDIEPDTESVGNLHFSSVSLVHRSNRARYYSEKFRDGIAERILSCNESFSQVRQSLGISDLDLQDWLNRYLQRRLQITLVGAATRNDIFDGAATDLNLVDGATDSTDERRPASAR